jgi:apolipoprotein N-acyltransferase
MSGILLQSLPAKAASLAALIAGALLPLAFAPHDLWFFALLSPAVLFICLQSRSPGKAALQGWLFGMGFFGTGASWVYVSIHVHGPAPAWLAAGLTTLFIAGIALFTALQCWLTATIWARISTSSRLQTIIVFLAVWVLAEWFRTWFLSGFPWLFLGNAMLDTPLSGYAPLGGVYLVSLMVLVSMGMIIWSVQMASLKTFLISSTVIVIVWMGGLGLAGMQWTQPIPKILQVGFVQPNIAQQDKWNPNLKAQQVQTILHLHRQLADQDIVVWPETALPLFKSQAEPLLQQLNSSGQTSQQAILLGILTAEKVPDDDPQSYHVYNSFLGTGTASGLYHKQKLVPFGEYVPLASVLRGLIAFFDLPMSNMATGGSGQMPLTAGAYRFMPFICYEIVYPDLVAEQAGEVDFLVTVSNDTWFGESIGPLQHLQMARMRALENQKPLLRGTNNGVTAMISQDGSITARLPQFEAGILKAEFQPRTGSTPFSQWGSWPVVVFLLAYVSLLVIRRK